MGTWTLKWKKGDGRGEVWAQVGETVGGLSGAVKLLYLFENEVKKWKKMFKQKGYSCMVKKITNRK